MTNDTQPTATLKVVTNEPLLAGQNQSLTLEIATSGYKKVIISVPLGNNPADLMTEEEFEKKKGQIKFPDNPPKSVSNKLVSERSRINDLPVGIVEISILNAKIELNFKIMFPNFIVQTNEGMVDITLYGTTNKNKVCSVQVQKTVELPKIEFFTANSYNGIQGELITLNWNIKLNGKFKLLCGQNTLANGDCIGTWKGQNQGSDFILNALVEEKIVDTRCLRIHSYDKTGFHSYRIEDSPTVIGVYANSKPGSYYGLYALLRFKEKPDEARLYFTNHGFDSTEWLPVKDGTGKAIAIPLQAARRPGVIFQNKLWLMGGDRCNPDEPGSEIAYYDFQACIWCVVDKNQDQRRWPMNMNARMGHAVLVLPSPDPQKSRLWIIGGYNQGGALEDIWEFDGNSWKELPSIMEKNSWFPRCLFGAVATMDAVWIAGGFAVPGGQPNDGNVFRYTRITHSWQAVSSICSSGYQYCASVLFTLDESGDKPYGIATFYDPVSSSYIHQTFFFSAERNDFPVTLYKIDTFSMHGIFPSLDYYHTQSTAFHGAVFFSTLKPDREWPDQNIHYLVRVTP